MGKLKFVIENVQDRNNERKTNLVTSLKHVLEKLYMLCCHGLIDKKRTI